LDKARALLAPIKEHSGISLSWGDLFAAAGTTALQSMGAKIERKCYGRTDDTDGGKSENLGPTSSQQEYYPCHKPNGQPDGTTYAGPQNDDFECESPLAVSSVGLIYLDPQGYATRNNGAAAHPLTVITDSTGATETLATYNVGDTYNDPSPWNPNYIAQVRGTFAAMEHDDWDTVALSGAHAVGKSHGACTAGGGTIPKDTYFKHTTGYDALPWMGSCNLGIVDALGNVDLPGRGLNTVTSGLEGPWTTFPTTFNNSYFQGTLDYDWTVHNGPGGQWQWKVTNPVEPFAPAHIMRLASDMTLKYDPVFKQIAQIFADPTMNTAGTDTKGNDYLNENFNYAWDTLTVVHGAGKWSDNAFCDDGSDPKVAQAVPAVRALAAATAATAALPCAQLVPPCTWTAIPAAAAGKGCNPMVPADSECWSTYPAPLPAHGYVAQTAASVDLAENMLDSDIMV